MRSELTPIIQRVQGMIAYVRENLDDQEYDLFCDLLVPEPQAKVTEKPKPIKRKKIEHCEVCNYTRRALVHKDESVKDYHDFVSSKAGGKSKRAKGIAAAIKDNLQHRESSVGGFADDVDGLQCQHEFHNGGTCKRTPDNNIHHLQTDSLYHEFVEGIEGKSHALAAGEGS